MEGNSPKVFYSGRAFSDSRIVIVNMDRTDIQRGVDSVNQKLERLGIEKQLGRSGLVSVYDYLDHSYAIEAGSSVDGYRLRIWTSWQATEDYNG